MQRALLLALVRVPRGARAVAAALVPRESRLIGLRALGYSHREPAALTGDSERTVERQLTRAGRRLRVATAGAKRGANG